MQILGIDNVIDNVFRPQTAWIALAVGIGCLTLALVVLMYARWGQARPLSKCVVLSVFAHVLLCGYAYMTHLFDERPRQLSAPAITVQLDAGLISEVEEQTEKEAKAWEQLPTRTPLLPAPGEPMRHAVDDAQLPARPASVPDQALTMTVPDPPFPIESEPTPTSTENSPLRPRPSMITAAAIAAPAARRVTEATTIEPSFDAEPPRMEPETTTPDRVARNVSVSQQTTMAELPNTDQQAEAIADVQDHWSGAIDPPPPVRTEAAAEPQEIDTLVETPPERRIDGAPVPKPYTGRVAPNRLQKTESKGGSRDTELAVQFALEWLASAQSPDGRWDASSWEAGRETGKTDQNRGGAGTQADTGITGLAVLAFLGAGQTHLEGKHRESVQHGLEFILRSQGSDGSLSGGATWFAAMYCHGIATLALSEAYAMTGDHRIRSRLQRAIAYTVRSQDPNGGGWRYRPGDSGDTSQFGWQLMSLVSAEHGDIPIPSITRQRMRRFLQSVSRGDAGGLASYLPRHEPKPAMTAEALVCRFFLREAMNPRTIDEAADYVLRELPGQGRPNYYYWYYGTLALYQLQDERWERWNEALKTELLQSQRNRGRLAGSWDPNTVYGGNGGRVYTTALAALCLEVYYRYLPMIEDLNGERPRMTRRP